ncbi:DUF3784 domain-containing protein [Fictibacillus sp. UD]|uniref:DUF3784 domain-containing protein n=1 Tax=Fictibacillus sp. UD TaxID=3038777 RepID=UPI003747285C
MNSTLIITAVILFFMAYLIGVKKQTWLLTGFNQQRVSNQDKLARLVGSYTFIMGVVMLAGAFIRQLETEVLFPVLVIGYVVLLGYVNTRMVK